MPRIIPKSNCKNVYYSDLQREYSIPPEFLSDFVSMIETGKASAEFVKLLDANAKWQSGVEMGLARRIEHIRQVLKA